MGARVIWYCCFLLAMLLVFPTAVCKGKTKNTINLCMDGYAAFDPFFVLSLTLTIKGAYELFLLLHNFMHYL